MKKALTGNMLIAQSGGPSMVINQSLVGAVLEAKKHGNIKKIFGARHGIKGILKEDFIELQRETVANLEAVATTPSSALGTVRQKPAAADCQTIFEILHKHDVRFFFYIGGNDSAETTHIINLDAQAAGYELHCFHIPKTIDNDLRSNDHTPGFGSAARFVASALQGINLDNRALPGVHISIIMGRHAGFLTAASALGRNHPDDGPHLIYLPERPFLVERFIADVERVYKRHGRCVVAISEGVCDTEGVPIVANFTKEVDSHGNVQLSGSGALGDLLSQALKVHTSIDRVRADTFGYLQRSFPAVVSEVDAREARLVGQRAVKEAVGGDFDGSIAIKRKPGNRYGIKLERVSLRDVARESREMPARFINKAGNNVTKAFLDYARPLVGKLPKIARLKGA
jgi:ATP-dependent phosphofructokinase / diphosphate-dependent phosphofructokinase